MKYLCINCSYIYDESLWDKMEWIEAWKTIEEMIWETTCPSCEWSMEDFQVIEEEILYPENDDIITSFEKQHVPTIKFRDDSKIEVTIWWADETHAMEEDHLISSIMLFDEYEDIIEERFLTHSEDPQIMFDISDLDAFEIRSRCNLHWLWSSWIIENNT